LVTNRWSQAKVFVVLFFVVQNDKIATEEKEYAMSATPIKDKSLMSYHAQKLCENFDAYWISPICTAADANERKFSQRMLSGASIPLGSPGPDPPEL